jgi:AbrB family looped-hinge helix DNA binding protein
MSKKREMKILDKNETCCPTSNVGEPCCHIEGVVQVDAKGQIYLPKSLRELMNIKKNDKLTVVVMRSGGKASSISLFKADKLDDTVKSIIGLK